MKIEAVKQNGEVINFIKNSSEKLQFEVAKQIEEIGNFHKIKTNENICKNCNELCIYKYSTGIFDSCPRFLEHLALKK